MIKPIGWLGSNSRSFSATTMFGASLTREDVIIRWHGNLGFHPNSDCGTLGEFYDCHYQLHNSETFLRMPPKFKRTAQPAVALALIIDLVRFRRNHSGVRPPDLEDKPTKRRRAEESTDQPLAKRTAGAKAFVSTFVPIIAAPVIPARPSCSVSFVFVALSNHGDPMFPWPGNTNKLNGRLYHDVIARGKDRTIFEFEADGITYVAKHGHTIPIVAADFIRARQYLNCTILWLHKISITLQRFYDAAEDLDQAREIHNGFDVQPTFLAFEDVTKRPPSVASGVTLADLKTAQEEHKIGECPTTPAPQIVWMIQRANSKAQDRWNFLKPETFQQNKIDATLVAFTHFFWEKHASSKAECLSYFQTTSGRMNNGQYGKLIFDALVQNDNKIIDPSRHGDENAVSDVLAAHQCNRVCGFMDLTPFNDEVDDEDADDAQC
ncbi:hypothetical protein DFH07DRAFT_781822 [Mycena maculata]|uniref:Alpha-type protein kinase domain-containing protein n=1 Tax=Mycena maculata TaxID=230809 RepID=A0AAD7MSD9_9AGAR|nr:hypothetical protein DFH07DRAFT_781822 [Mycena maculata]